MTADGNDLSDADALKATQLRLSTMRRYLNACVSYPTAKAEGLPSAE